MSSVDVGYNGQSAVGTSCYIVLFNVVHGPSPSAALEALIVRLTFVLPSVSIVIYVVEAPEREQAENSPRPFTVLPELLGKRKSQVAYIERILMNDLDSHRTAYTSSAPVPALQPSSWSWSGSSRAAERKKVGLWVDGEMQTVLVASAECLKQGPGAVHAPDSNGRVLWTTLVKSYELVVPGIAGVFTEKGGYDREGWNTATEAPLYQHHSPSLSRYLDDEDDDVEQQKQAGFLHIPSPAFYVAGLGRGYGLFAGMMYEQDGEEADKIYEAVSEAMDSRSFFSISLFLIDFILSFLNLLEKHKSKLELRSCERKGRNFSNNFADLKRGLSAVTDEEWRVYPSVLVDDRSKTEFENALDERQHLNPKHAPGWIAAACLEEHAGKMVAARKIIHCPKSEDVWLPLVEADRLYSSNTHQRLTAVSTSKPSPQMPVSSLPAPSKSSHSPSSFGLPSPDSNLQTRHCRLFVQEACPSFKFAEQQNKELAIVYKTFGGAVGDIRRHQVLLTRGQRLNEAESREEEAIVMGNNGMEEHRLDSRVSDAEAAEAKSRISTARGFWRLPGRGSLDAALERIVVHCLPSFGPWWLWRRGSMVKFQLLDQSSNALSCLRRRMETLELREGREVSIRAGTVIDTDWVWMLYPAFENQQSRTLTAFESLPSALERFRRLAKSMRQLATCLLIALHSPLGSKPPNQPIL
ncbi:hypothetical protein CPC08DRAFT_730324 [Agrocybe pediades]|nr:hypothetical protein CPC08DRAFT_730324 [Agrocybe pediades]